MAGTGGSDASIQDFFHPTPNSSPLKKLTPQAGSSNLSIGDGFTPDEVHEALKPAPAKPWHPTTEYAENDIGHLYPGPRAVTFTGRLANVFEVSTTGKAPRSAKGCVKLCIKDDTGAITIRLWYAIHVPKLRLGSLVTVWTSHISAGDNGMMISPDTPLSASIFPERDRSCHLLSHQTDKDNGTLCTTPLNYREGHPLADVMTLRNFFDGGCDVPNARILVLLKSVGFRKGVTRRDGSKTMTTSVRVHDHTAEAALGLWGTAALSPFAITLRMEEASSSPDVPAGPTAWKAGETVLLIQAPTCNTARGPYLTLNASSIMDINPSIPDAHWLRNWHLRQKRKECTNPPFPENIFNYNAIISAPKRCLYTLAELDEFARAAPTAIFSGFLSLLITEIKLLDCWKRGILLSGDCSKCNTGRAVFANTTSSKCSACDAEVALRLNPRVLGQVIDETAAISAGKLVLSDEAWEDLLGREPADLLLVGYEGLKALADRLLFCRVTMVFGWTGDERKAGGRICVLRIRP